MQKSDKTLVIITGGTIDAMYSPEDGTPYMVPVPATPEESCIPAALDMLGLSAQCTVWLHSMTDSKTLDTATLDTLWEHIVAHQCARAVLVQGTDTMVKTGRYFGEKHTATAAAGNLRACRIIITGAMTPLRDKNGRWRGLDAAGAPMFDAPLCDGWGNLARAVADAGNDALPYSVYVRIGVRGMLAPAAPWNPWHIEKHVVIDDVAAQATVQQSYFALI